MSNFSKILRSVSLTALMIALASSSACSKKPKPDEGVVPTAGADENASGDSDSGKAMGLQTVRFAFDSSNLTSESKSILKANAEILKAKSGVKIQIEGHCDTHGGIQYNIALGERRANAVMKFLQDLGVSGDRLSTISFGKERLLDSGTSEAADAKNRRANFVITSR